MTTLLHIDSSARIGSSKTYQYGSHSRRLTAHFMETWRNLRPDDHVIYRDVSADPPSFISSRWIHAAFTREDQREQWMQEILSASDILVAELLAADIIVVGVPMYNFGPPAQFKAYIDNIVRVGLTFGFDRTRAGDPYWPLLSHLNKHLVILSSRGNYGYNHGEHNADNNHVERSITTPFGYIGITNVSSLAIEYDEFADERLAESIEAAETRVDQLVYKLANMHAIK